MGSSIQVKSADNPISLLGEEVDFLILSEGANLADSIWERYLRGRIINRHGKVFIPSTPAGNGGFVHKFFIKGMDYTQNEVRSFQYSCYDCPHIDREEIEDAKNNLSEEAFAEQWLGKFVTYQGLVYKEFDVNKHVVADFQIPMGWERYRAIDYGVSNPFVCLWFAVSPDGTVYCYDEHYQVNMTIRDHVEVIKGKTGRDKVMLSYIDPSAGIKLDLMQYGIPVLDADNDIPSGISRVHEYLATDRVTGKPRLMVMRSCIHTIEEFMKYCRKEIRAGMNSNENPLKKSDHTMDALRYFITSRPRFGGVTQYAPEGSVEWYLNNLPGNREYDKFIGNQN
jgi:phage terminase large subunit